MRKLALALVFVLATEKPVLSVFFVMYSAIFMIWVVGLVEPMREMNWLIFLNESFNLMFCYLLLLETNFMTDLKIRETWVGNGLIWIALTNLSVNLAIALS